MEEKLKQIKSDCKKVVLYGPESTGKTTLSIELAKHFKTNWVPEYAREYLQNVWDNEKRICEPKDILPIAIGGTAIGVISFVVGFGIFIYLLSKNSTVVEHDG